MGSSISMPRRSISRSAISASLSAMMALVTEAVELAARAGAHFDIDASAVQRLRKLAHILQQAQARGFRLLSVLLDALQFVVRGGHGELLWNQVVARKAVLDFLDIAALRDSGDVLQKYYSHGNLTSVR